MKGSKSCSTPFSPAFVLEAAAFNFLFLLSDGSSLCLNTTYLPVSSDLSTHQLPLAVCYGVSRYIDTPTSPCLIASWPCFSSPSQTLCPHDPLAFLICLSVCFSRTQFTQSYPGYLRKPLKDGVRVRDSTPRPQFSPH